MYQPAQPFGYPQQPQFPAVPYERFLENISFQYTYLARLHEQEDTLGIQDFDISATGLFPDFLFSQQPLLVTPAFVLHLWDGPTTGVQDLPSKAYTAYID